MGRSIYLIKLVDKTKPFSFTPPQKQKVVQPRSKDVVVQRRQRIVQKRVMHVQSCCFANLNLKLVYTPVAAVVVVTQALYYPVEDTTN